MKLASALRPLELWFKSQQAGQQQMRKLLEVSLYSLHQAALPTCVHISLWKSLCNSHKGAMWASRSTAQKVRVLKQSWAKAGWPRGRPPQHHHHQEQHGKPCPSMSAKNHACFKSWSWMEEEENKKSTLRIHYDNPKLMQIFRTNVYNKQHPQIPWSRKFNVKGQSWWYWSNC